MSKLYRITCRNLALIRIFWEGPKIWKSISILFGITCQRQMLWESFCGLLGIYELYKIRIRLHLDNLATLCLFCAFQKIIFSANFFFCSQAQSCKKTKTVSKNANPHYNANLHYPRVSYDVFLNTSIHIAILGMY